jgi:multiple sugar transport system substrate-binding protein
MSGFRPQNVTTVSALTRRQFLGTTGAMGLLAVLALRQAPVFAQRRELSMITWNHFVPASDERLKEIAADFSKRTNVNLRVDTIAHLQLPQKWAAEVQTKSGHDLVFTYSEAPYLYEQYLAPMEDVVAEIEKKYGGFYPFAKEASFVNGTWRALPWMWISFPGTYNQTLFKGYNQPVPDTWEDLLKVGRELKKAGHPVGVAISHCDDANTTFWSVLWCHGGKVLEPDGKTIAINSPQTQQVLDYYKTLYHEAMDADVLSWDDASNNRCVLSGKCSWIHNPVSPYNTALAKKMPIAQDLNHHTTLAGPAGRHFGPPIHQMGIWNFSKNIDVSKDFLRFFYEEENYSSWVTAGNGFNHAPVRFFENHPVWAKDPKLAMLPKEGEYAHARGWPAPPNHYIVQIETSYILPDMVAKVIQGASTKEAIHWAEEQIGRMLKG